MERKPKMTQIANIVGLLKDYEYKKNLTSYLNDHKVSYSVIELLNSIGVIQRDIKFGYRLYRCKNADIASEHIVYINYNKYRLDKVKVTSVEQIDLLTKDTNTRIDFLKKLFDLDYDKVRVKQDNLPHRIVNPFTGEVLASFLKLQDYNTFLPLFERMYAMKFENDLSFLIKTRVIEDKANVLN